MDKSMVYRIAERFAGMSLAQRQAVYQKIRQEGISLSQLPVVARVVGSVEQLSYAQQRQWFLWQLEPNSTAYHIAGALRIQGDLNIEAVQHSFQALVARHASLRTTFQATEDGLAQPITHAEQAFELNVIDCRNIPEQERELCIAQAARQINEQPFDLSKDALLRVAVIQAGEADHVLVLVMHHIISDGWSMQLIIEEFAACYKAYGEETIPALADLTLQYADYAAWQRSWLEAGETERQLTYWRQQLGNEQPVLQLPTDYPRHSVANYHAARHEWVLPASLAGQLKAFAQQQGMTLFMLLLTAFQVLLSRYATQSDIRVGVPIANRHRLEIEGIVGFFINTQVLRNNIEPRQPLSAVLAQARSAALAAQDHQDLPFEQLVDALQPERSLSYNPLFQVMFNHLREDFSALAHMAGLSLSKYSLGEQTAQFELSLHTTEHADGSLSALINYAKELFSPDTIQQFAGHFETVLHALVNQADCAVADITLLNQQEQQQLLAWSKQVKDYRPVVPVHQLIEQQVRLNPHATALKCGDQHMSYAELNARANQLAHYLGSLGVTTEVKVGVAAERSFEMIIALLAIMKSGGAYVPLDPDYPSDRLSYLLDDSGVQLVLTQQHLAHKLPLSAGDGAAGIQRIELEKFAYDDWSEDNPNITIRADQLIYLIYTSGSTGKPKGAANSHAGLYNRIVWGQHYSPLTADDVVLQKTPYSFDISFWEMFWPLTAGATLAISLAGDHRDPARLIELITRHSVTTIHFVPSMLQAFIQYDGVDNCTAKLKQIICSGEALPAELLKATLNKLPETKLLNLYGPTEAAIEITYWPCSDDGSTIVPIGQPIDNCSSYVLDSNLQLVPRGVAGELYLGGVGLARGYHQRAGLTAERFVANPFDTYGGRLYRTGDLVRWRLDGQIEYLGRLDHQIKIRGFRVELGEIEAQLQARNDVAEAVVIAQKNAATTRLVAYVVATPQQQDQPLDVSALKAALAEVLPDYMVPQAMVQLDKMPLSANGKIDRKLLPEVAISSAVESDQLPQGEIEQTLAAIWSTVLGVSNISRQDNFFELGGDSIISLQIVAKARQQGFKLSPKHIFERQTLAELARLAADLKEDKPTSTKRQVISGEVALLPIQAKFFETAMTARHHWNQAVMLRSSTPLNAAALTQALHYLEKYHDALRLRYDLVDGQWQQQYKDVSQDSSLLWVRQIDENAQGLEALCDEAQASLNLSEGPLLRAVLIESGIEQGKQQQLLIAIHHLLVDGVSWRILLEDLQQAYQQAVNGQPIILAEKSDSYQLFSQQFQQYPQQYPHELAYWQQLSAHVPADLNTNTALFNTDADNKAGNEALVTVNLSQVLTDKMLKQALSRYRLHINDVLLAALTQAWSAWSGQHELLVDIEGHGRETLLDESIDISRTVGWFTSLYPVLLQSQTNANDALKNTKETLRQVPHKGLGYGAFKYLGDASQQQAIRDLPQAKVVFNYLGQFDSQASDKEDSADTRWSLSLDNTGRAIDVNATLWHDISINGQVYNGELSLSVAYNQTRYQSAHIEKLAQLFVQQLSGLIEFCSAETTPAAVSPADFPLADLSQAQLDQLALAWAEVEDIYPLSPMQSGLLFHSMLEPDHSTYLTQIRVDIRGLEPERFKQAWQLAFDRHDMLRTGFLGHADSSLQWVKNHIEVPFNRLDWQQHTPQIEAALTEQAKLELSQGFELNQPPLTRLCLIQIAPETYHLIWTSHHLLFDGWSTAQLLSEVFRSYQGQTIASNLTRYRDYIHWLQKYDAAEAEQYWSSLFKPLDQMTQLVPALPKLKQQDTNINTVAEFYQTLPASLADKLNQLARQERVTLNTLLQAAWALLLQRYTGQQVVSFGTTTAGRPSDLAGVEQLLGLFINTLPVLAVPHAHIRLKDWLQQLQTQALASREFEQTPLNEIQRWIGQGGQSLFDTLLVFENYPVDDMLEQSEMGHLQFSNITSSSGNHYPLTIRVIWQDAKEGQDALLRLEYLYDKTLLNLTTIEWLAQQVDALLQQISRSAEQYLGDIAIAHPQALIGLIAETDHLAQSVPPLVPVHVAVAQHAIHQPLAWAVNDGQQRYSYAQLEQATNVLANKLVAQGVGINTKVAVYAERSCEFVLGLLSVLKAGAVFVPLDPKLPEDRLQYQLADSECRWILQQQDVPFGVNIPHLKLDFPLYLNETAPSPLGQTIHPQQAAYIIYTSGSTGRPKGVIVTHFSLSQYVSSILAELALTPSIQTMAMVSTVAADLGHTTLFGALVSGRELHLLPATLAFDPDQFAAYMQQHHIDVLKIVPSHLQALLQAANPADVLPRQRLILGGEASSIALYQQIKQLKPECQVMNHYGPTETTVGVLTCNENRFALYNAREAFTSLAYLPLGQPLSSKQQPQTEVYVLDSALQAVPAGIAGELYIGGAGLAQAYQGRAGQTAERFVPHPYKVGERLYRSGDRVRWNNEGDLEFLGRVDDQVKIRGYRVEPSELTSIIESQLGIKQAVSVVRSNSTLGADAPAQLYAYIVLDQTNLNAIFELSAFQQALVQLLPEYMLPSQVIVLDALPLTVNGKVDKKALPEAQHTKETVFNAPESETEQALADIWAEVLGITQVGRDDNFFALGGDSILSLKVIARARKRALKLTPKQLFEYQTLTQLAEVVAQNTLAAQNAGTASKKTAIAKPVLKTVERQAHMPLSFAQQRQWFLWQLDPQSTAYHIAGALQLKGRLDVPALQQAFQSLVGRHESLRTYFGNAQFTGGLFASEQDGQAVQIIRPALALQVPMVDLSHSAEADQPEHINDILEQLNGQPFDLTEDALLRVNILKLADNNHILAVVMHHIISDGWSLQVLLQELVALYQAQVSAQHIELASMPIQYVDYAVWQRQWLAAGEQQRQLAYWKEQLGDTHPVLQLATDYARQPSARYQAARHVLQIPATLTQAIKASSQGTTQSTTQGGLQGTTLFMNLLAAFQILMARYSGQQDIRVGVPIANRQRLETENVVGFFVNTQVLRSQLTPQQTFADVLAQVKETVINAQANADLPFEQLVEALQPERSLSHPPLFQVMINFQRAEEKAFTQLPQLTVSDYALPEQAAQFELKLDITEYADQRIEASFSYARELFHPSTIQHMANHYLQLLTAIATQPQQAWATLDVLSTTEQQTLDGWSYGKPLPQHEINTFVPVHQLFERQVEQTPDAIALVFADVQLNYAQLNDKANQLAHYLIGLGVTTDSKVGVALERSVEMVVSLLAIVKAGAAYVPFDPDYPLQRLRYMLDDSDVSVLLTQQHVQDVLADTLANNKQVLTLVCVDQLTLDVFPRINPQPVLHAKNLAYMIYTSGSTGQPKGAANTHEALHNRLAWMQAAYPLTAKDSVLQKTPFSFDVSVWEFFWPLMVGARLVVAGVGDHRDPERLAGLIQQHQISTLHFVPSMLQAFMLYDAADTCTSLRQIMCSGEALSADLQNQALQRLPQAKLYNLYGPTEAAIDVTHWTCHHDGQQQVPIGQPIANIDVHVLDEYLNRVPRGVAGELYLGGIGLARAYHNRAALTAERFVASPLAQQGERLYRTGDLVRWRPDGQIEYLGRLDHQIKIRGFRVELGEIEAQLLAQQDIHEAVVVAQDAPQGTRLVAYISAAAEIDIQGLRLKLAQQLPDYMVPALIVQLDQLPLNSNGKVDRRALPDIAHLKHKTHQPPQGELEKLLANIWSKVLGVAELGRDDDFFALGGHSLAVLQVQQQVYQALAVRIALKRYFEAPVLSDFAMLLEEEQANAVSEQSDLDQMSALLDSLEAN